jgi:iron complex outermembrane receptor protein
MNLRSPMISTMKRALLTLGLSLGLLVQTALADESGEADVAELEDFVISEVTDDLSILPSEPSDGAFGLDLTLLETPRSVTEVSADLIKSYGLRSVDDLVRLTPGAFTSSFFGIRGAMDIRGAAADNYFRGFRRIANPGAFNTIVRGAESLEVLRGPVSPLYGHGSVGGQLNYSPKTSKSETAKYITDPTGRVDVTVGSYDQKLLAVEYGAPFTTPGGKQAGVYFFGEIEDSGSFYHGYNPTSELAQLAFDMDYTENTTLEFGVQYQTSDSIQVPGWTRVTQELIDSGEYITGTPSALNDPARLVGADRLTPQESGSVGAFAPFFINNSFSATTNFCFPSDAQGLTFTFRGITRDVCAVPLPDPITNVGLSSIDHRTTFIDPLDFADTEAITAYFDAITKLGDNLTWKNQFFYDYLDHTKYQSWGFTALYPGVEHMELRSSLTLDYDTSSFESQTIVGLNVRKEDTDHKEAWYDENFDRRDMLVGPTPDDRIDWAVVDPWANATILYDDDGAPSGLEGTVRRNFNGEQKSRMINTGLFFLSDISFGKLNLLIGGRYDQFDVDSRDDALTLLGIPFDGRGTLSDDDDATSYNFSLSYSSDFGLRPYITVAESSSLSTNQVGGINPGAVADMSFVQTSEITEGGFKYSGMDGAFYAAVAYYDQERTFRDGQTQALVAQFGKGLEAETRIVINDSFYLTATLTNSDITEVSDGALAVINHAQFAEQNGLEPTDLYNTRISGNRFVFVGNQTEVDTPGLPDTVASAYGSYVFPAEGAEMVASLGFTYADETYMDVTESTLLPSYMVWTTSLSYLTDSYEVMATVNNLFDEEYYTKADLFDGVVVKPSEGRTISVMFSYKF